MTNYERIKAMSLEEMVAFVEEAEEKAKNYVDNYTDDDYFACSANSHVKDVFKIICKTDGDE